jgi:hypothetical protein
MGDYKNIALLSEKTGIHKSTICSRIGRGLTQEQAVAFKPRVYIKGVQLAADLAGVSKHMVVSRIKEGVPIGQALKNPKPKQYLDVEKIRHLVEVDKLSLNRVAFIVGCNRTYLPKFCQKNGIKTNVVPFDKIIFIDDGAEYTQLKLCKKYGWSMSSFISYKKNRPIMTHQESFESYKKYKGVE